MALLAYNEAADEASRVLRRTITAREVRRWVGAGSLADVWVNQIAYIDATRLTRWLKQITPEWKMLTIPEAAVRVQKLTKRLPTVETVRNWCIRGHLGPDGQRVILPAIKEGRRRLIDPQELREFVWGVLPHGGRPAGRPLGQRAGS